MLFRSEGGKVKSADEYKEMTEFAGQVGSLLKTLPDKPEKAALLKIEPVGG